MESFAFCEKIRHLAFNKKKIPPFITKDRLKKILEEKLNFKIVLLN